MKTSTTAPFGRNVVTFIFLLLPSFLTFTTAFLTPSSPFSTLSRKSTRSTGDVSMKLYDWKRRNDVEVYEAENPDKTVFTLNNLRPSPGSTKRKNRKGRGIAAGQGASCGYGMRGQNSRGGVRPGFEGGQNPLYRRIPKLPGRPMGAGHTKTEYGLIPTTLLNACQPGETVNFDTLHEGGIISKQSQNIFKVTGGEELSVENLTVQAHAFTESAYEAIVAKGGKCELLSPTTNEVLVFEEEEESASA